MEKIKPFLFAGDMTAYIDNPKELPEIPRIIEFGKVAGYKQNTQKSTALLCTNNKRGDIKILKTPYSL